LVENFISEVRGTEPQTSQTKNLVSEDDSLELLSLSTLFEEQKEFQIRPKHFIFVHLNLSNYSSDFLVQTFLIVKILSFWLLISIFG